MYHTERIPLLNKKIWTKKLEQQNPLVRKTDELTNHNRHTSWHNFSQWDADKCKWILHWDVAQAEHQSTKHCKCHRWSIVLHIIIITTNGLSSKHPSSLDYLSFCLLPLWKELWQSQPMVSYSLVHQNHTKHKITWNAFILFPTIATSSQ